MKRSEMIKIIVKQLEWIRFIGAHNLDEIHAEHLLHEIEQAGMSPPEIRILEHSYDRANGQMGFMVHEWEDET